MINRKEMIEIETYPQKARHKLWQDIHYRGQNTKNLVRFTNVCFSLHLNLKCLDGNKFNKHHNFKN